MTAFVPGSGFSTFGCSRVGKTAICDAALWTQGSDCPAHKRGAQMSAYPYTGSGYGSSGVPYASDRFGQAFKQTKTKDVVDTLSEVPVFSTLVSLLVESGLDYELRKGGPFTVFAPTNSAFASLLDPHGFKMLAPLLRPENREELKSLLAYHVMKGEISYTSMIADGKVTGETLAGVELVAMGYGKKVSAGSAAVVKGDVPCKNGVVHVLSSVLVPPTFVPQPAGPVKKKFFTSTVLDIYANTLTPRQAIGIDPLPAGYDSSALAKFD